MSGIPLLWIGCADGTNPSDAMDDLEHFWPTLASALDDATDDPACRYSRIRFTGPTRESRLAVIAFDIKQNTSWSVYMHVHYPLPSEERFEVQLVAFLGREQYDYDTAYAHDVNGRDFHAEWKYMEPLINAAATKAAENTTLRPR